MFSLRNKLFLAFLLSSLLLVVGMVTLFQWSFDRGFVKYINQLEQKRLETLAPALETYFANTGSWSDLGRDDLEQLLSRQRNPRRVFHEPRPDLSMPPPGDPGFSPPPDEPPPDGRRDGMGPGHPGPPSVFILDANRNPVIGTYHGNDDTLLQPLKQGDRLIGYAGVEHTKVPKEILDRQFAANQSHNFIYIALIALLVSALVAFPLASFLVQRIRKLLAHIQELSRGNYDHRIQLQGQDELNLLAAHLNDLGAALHNSVQSRRAMVADISHELRTPIAVLRAQLEAIEDGVQPCNGNTIQRMVQQTLRLSNLVNDLYELSLADIGALSYRKQELDLRPLLRQLLQSSVLQIEQAGLTLSSAEDDGQALNVLGDPQRLQQLFGNILQNSLHYTHSPGQIKVDIRRDGQDALITVSDSAPGVDPTLLPKLFERLFRADSSRNRDSGGAGLGLSLCQTITQAHGGTISAANSELGGIAVSVRIPLISI